MVEQCAFNTLVLGSNPGGSIGYIAERSKAAVCKTVWVPFASSNLAVPRSGDVV